MMWNGYGMGWMWIFGLAWLVAVVFILSLVFWLAKKLVYGEGDRKRH